jgi:hypothetical protein
MSPRRAALVGIVFVVIGVAYGVAAAISPGATIDVAGVTMLIALGGAMSVMAYVLFTGLKRS